MLAGHQDPKSSLSLPLVDVTREFIDDVARKLRRHGIHTLRTLLAKCEIDQESTQRMQDKHKFRLDRSPHAFLVMYFDMVNATRRVGLSIAVAEKLLLDYGDASELCYFMSEFDV
jgi:hypothetical protein